MICRITSTKFKQEKMPDYDRLSRIEKMKVTRKTEISIQQTRRLVVVPPKTEAVFICPQCESGEAMLIAEKAASVFGFSRRKIYRLVEEGQIDFIETEEGVLYICRCSLEQINANSQF